MAFEKGKSGNPAGKPVGTVSKLNKTFKELLLSTIDELQNDPKAKLAAWAKENPTEFYKIAARLIPTEVNAKVEAVQLRDWVVTPVKPEDSDEGK